MGIGRPLANALPELCRYRAQYAALGDLRHPTCSVVDSTICLYIRRQVQLSGFEAIEGGDTKTIGRDTILTMDALIQRMRGMTTKYACCSPFVEVELCTHHSVLPRGQEGNRVCW